MLLTAPFDPGAVGIGRPPSRAERVAAAGAVALIAVGLAMEAMGGSLRGVGRGVASGAVHGAFLVGGASIAGGTASSYWRVVLSAAVLLAASVLSRLGDWGALLYLLPPILLVWATSADGAFRGIGVHLRARARHVVYGLAAGAFLGTHLLVSASLTLGYVVGLGSPSQYLSALAYDVGANGLTAEWLFRGALFTRFWRRWEFWPAACASTALAIARYVLDLAVPAALEVKAGTLFYTALLGFTACALRAESGSLLPGYLATGLFFAAYRMLSQ